MAKVIKYKPARHSTLMWVLFLVLISLALNAAIIFVLFQVRASAKTMMLQAASQIDTLASDHIRYTVKINQTLPVATEININQEIPVPVSLTVDHTIPVKTEIPFQDELTILLDLPGETIPISTTIPFSQVITVPVTLNVADLLPSVIPAPLGREIEVPLKLDTGHTLSIDSRVLLNSGVAVPLTLAIDQVFTATTTLLGQEIEVPVQLDVNRVISATAALLPGKPVTVPLAFSLEGTLPAGSSAAVGPTNVRTTSQTVIIPIPSAEELVANIPPAQRTVQLDIPIPIRQEFSVNAEAPLDLPFGDGLTVQVDKTIPLDLEIPVNIPIETEVIVPIDMTVPVAMEVPVVMDVPIDIAISDTPFGAYLHNLGNALRQATTRF